MSAIERRKVNFLQNKSTKGTLMLASTLAVVYFAVITFMFPVSSKWLYGLLIAGEVFHLFQVLMYIATAWPGKFTPYKDESFNASVDIYVTVVNEPLDIVEETIRAAKAISYPNKKIYILNDGFVAKKDNWEDMETLARKLDVGCITRRIGGGAKAGNINNATRETGGDFIVIFDADHVPHADFLSKTMPHFGDDKVAFVQSPQFYKNYSENYVTRSSWEQQELFFGPICAGKNRTNSATMCGTNMVIRRSALLEAGGMSEKSIAEDFLTGLYLHSHGWKSVYVPEVLAEGLAPEDYLSYTKQQFRWARGAFDVFGHGFFAGKGLTFTQKLQYFSSVSFYFSGLVIAMNALIPVVYFFTGIIPFTISTMLLATVFLPYIFLTLFVLQSSSNFSFTFRALTFSMGSFNIHLAALWAAITRQKTGFAVTPKKQQEGNFVSLVIPHIAYVIIVIAGMTYAILREGLSASFVANAAWALLNIALFAPCIYAALPIGAKKMNVQRQRVSTKESFKQAAASTADIKELNLTPTK